MAAVPEELSLQKKRLSPPPEPSSGAVSPLQPSQQIPVAERPFLARAGPCGSRLLSTGGVWKETAWESCCANPMPSKSMASSERAGSAPTCRCYEQGWCLLIRARWQMNSKERSQHVASSAQQHSTSAARILTLPLGLACTCDAQAAKPAGSRPWCPVVRILVS